MDIDKLINRLEAAHVLLAERGEPAAEETSQMDEMAILRSVCLRNTDTVQQCIKRRNALEKNGQARSADGIAAAAAVRRELNELAMSADQLRKAHEENKKERGSSAWEDRVVSDLLRNVNDCVDSEMKRMGTVSAEKPGWSGKSEPDLGLAAAGSSLKIKGGSAAAAKADPEMHESLLEVKHRDQDIEYGLTSIQEGLGRLKGIATDMHQEVLVQSIMIDEIQAKADHVDDELRNINKRLAKNLRDAGGASRIFVNIFLFVLLMSLVLFVYCTIRDAHPW